MNLRPILAAAALLVVSAAVAADWPQFRGPNRDGVSRETGLLQDWPAGGPRLLWTSTNLGIGYAGPAVAGDRLYTAGGRGDAEYVIALDLKPAADGMVKEGWSAKIGPLFTWKGNSWNAGPNATPTVDGDAVYALGGFGDLVCLDAATGQERWRVSLPRDLGGQVNPIGGGLEDPTPLGWGYAAAPLVDGNQLICVPGGKKGLLAALDKKTGKVLWRSTEVGAQAPYSSPVAAEIGGKRQYVQVTNTGIVGIATEDGKKLWEYRRPKPYNDVVIATPVVRDGVVFASVGFGEGFDLIRVVPQNGAFTVVPVASGPEVQNRDGGVVLLGDHLFGHSEQGGWFCQDFKTGKVQWTEGRALGRGSIAAADGRLICCAEKGGAVALVEPSPEGWKEHGRLMLPRASKLRKPSGGLWTHPVVADGRLYVRDQELLFCYDVKK